MIDRAQLRTRRGGSRTELGDGGHLARAAWRRRAIDGRSGCTPEAICVAMARDGSSTPAIRQSVSRRPRASLGEFAWVVVSEPSCPVFIAWSHVERLTVLGIRRRRCVGRARMRRAFLDQVVDPVRPRLPGSLASLERDDVRLHQLELGGVLDRHDALLFGDRAREHAEQRGLAASGSLPR